MGAAPVESVTGTGELRVRAVSFALIARTLGSDPAPLVDPESIDALRRALAAAGASSALGRLAEVDQASVPAVGELAGRWVRWFDLGRVAPYEGSNVASTAGGVTPRLADVAGFYRAFGLQVVDDRPDHVVAQLEFLAMAVLAEAEAIENDRTDDAGAAADAIRSFLRDHVGGWIDAWAARVGAIAELNPWAPYAAAAAELVRTEAALRNVIPLTDAAVLVADAGIADDEEAEMACEDAL